MADGAVTAAKAARDAKAKDVIVIDLREVSFMTDYFIICSGDSDTQIQSIVRKVKDELKKSGFELLRVEGYQTAQWVLLDFGDFVVHVFHKEARSFYNLERLWGDAPLVEYDYAVE